jgi:hypothetical protein
VHALAARLQRFVIQGFAFAQVQARELHDLEDTSHKCIAELRFWQCPVPSRLHAALLNATQCNTMNASEVRSMQE